MLEESLFVSIANIRKKNLLRLKKLSSIVWPPDISLFPESLQKTWGRGWSRRYLRHFTTVLRYTKRRSAWFGFCSVGGTGGTTTRCQLVEPRAQQWTSTSKLWRKWLHYITYATLVLTACPCILHLSELTAVAEHHQYTAFYLLLCCNGGSFFWCQTRPPQQLAWNLRSSLIQAFHSKT